MTMRVPCEVEQIELEGDYTDRDGNAPAIPSLSVTCLRCHHCVEVYGQTDRSERAAFAMLRDECHYGERNYYYSEQA